MGKVSDKTLEVEALALSGVQPKEIALRLGMSTNVVTKTIARARKRGVINFYFNADGTTKPLRSMSNEATAVRSFFNSRGITVGYAREAVQHLDRDTRVWVADQIRDGGYASLTEFLRDLVIRAYDEAHMHPADRVADILKGGK